MRHQSVEPRYRTAFELLGIRGPIKYENPELDFLHPDPRPSDSINNLIKNNHAQKIKELDLLFHAGLLTPSDHIHEKKDLDDAFGTICSDRAKRESYYRNNTFLQIPINSVQEKKETSGHYDWTKDPVAGPHTKIVFAPPQLPELKMILFTQKQKTQFKLTADDERLLRDLHDKPQSLSADIALKINELVERINNAKKTFLDNKNKFQKDKRTLLNQLQTFRIAVSDFIDQSKVLDRYNAVKQNEEAREKAIHQARLTYLDNILNDIKTAKANINSALEQFHQSKSGSKDANKKYVLKSMSDYYQLCTASKLFEKYQEAKKHLLKEDPLIEEKLKNIENEFSFAETKYNLEALKRKSQLLSHVAASEAGLFAPKQAAKEKTSLLQRIRNAFCRRFS